MWCVLCVPCGDSMRSTSRSMKQCVAVAQSKMGTGKDFEMSPFEAARKLLSMESLHISLGTQSDLVFQDMDLVPLLIQENYLNHRPVVATNDQMRMQVRQSLAARSLYLQLCFSAQDLIHPHAHGCCRFTLLLANIQMLMELQTMYAHEPTAELVQVLVKLSRLTLCTTMHILHCTVML